jgi:hypothetical protein
MALSVSSCSCGNLRITGKDLPARSRPNIPSSERARFLPLLSCSCVFQRGISVTDFSTLLLKSHSTVCADIACSACSSAFRFFNAPGASYFGPVREARHSSGGVTSLPLSNGPGQSLSRFPKFLQNLMNRQPTPIVRSSDAGNLGDGDFDFMFSRKLDPVVGSCRRFVVPPELLFLN